MRSGDLGYRDADGFFFVTGRIKELIIKGGENIAPREIDEALLPIPRCSTPRRSASPTATTARRSWPASCCATAARATEAELRGFCLAQLGRLQDAEGVPLRGELPRGPSGKVQRLKLLELLGS